MTKGRATATKATAGYAVYKTAVGVTRSVADRLCHVLEIDSDYSDELSEAGHIAAERNMVKIPGAKGERVRAHRVGRSDIDSDDGFSAVDWVWTPIPGVARLLQARTTHDGIEFRAARRSDLDALFTHLEEIVEERQANAPTIEFDPVEYRRRTGIMAWHGSNKEWRNRKSRVSRSFDSVILPAKLQAEIEDDIRRFTESRERLQRLEVPWRRGYLLDGPPGTGKTSVSLAIAAALKFDLATLSLTDIGSDSDLRQAISELNQNGCVLVIEDIDAYSVSNDREHNATRDGALSLSGLLNALDGFETPDGLVTIATTNHVDHLDPALVRSGRLDRQFHLGYIEAPELERLYHWFYEAEPPSPAPLGTGSAGLVPAEAAELFKQHLDDAEAGWKAVLDRIGNPLRRLSAVA